MTTLITRWWWIVVTLMVLSGVLFLLMYTHTANIVQSAVNEARQVAAITADSSALQEAISKSLGDSLPSSSNGISTFVPAQDIHVTEINQGKDVQVSVTYHMPVLGPVQHLFGLGATIPITRTATQAIDYALNGLQATLQSPPSNTMGVNQVTLNSSGGSIHITIEGYGFGPAPSGVPGTTTGSFFILQDLSQGWQAGTSASGLAITYGSWSDSTITVTGINGYGKGTEMISPGDNMQVTVSVGSAKTTYDFVANLSGTTKYSVSLSSSASITSTGSGVTLTASSSVNGNGTNGIGIYDATANKYLTWAGNGMTVTQLVNGAATSHTYIAYFGPQGDIVNALATSDDIGVTWTANTSDISAVMMSTSAGSYYLEIFGNDLNGALVSGTGLSGTSQVNAYELQVQAASINDTSGVVTLTSGQTIPFAAMVY